MKKFLFAAAALSLLLVIPAPDATAAPMGGLGFHAGATPFDGFGFLTGRDFAAPSVGLRHWFNDQVGVDLGLGYFQLSADPGDDKLTGFMLGAGVPISLKRVSDHVNFILRPGLLWGTVEEEIGPAPVTTVKWTAFALSGELEAEWMVTDRLSVSASHGLSYGKIEDDGSPKTTFTSFGTLGNNFTQLGFHVYLW